MKKKKTAGHRLSKRMLALICALVLMFTLMCSAFGEASNAGDTSSNPETVREVPNTEPTEDPAPSEEPTESPAPSEEPTESPAPSEEPTESPAPTEEPTESPEPSEEPVAKDPEFTANVSNADAWAKEKSITVKCDDVDSYDVIVSASDDISDKISGTTVSENGTYYVFIVVGDKTYGPEKVVVKNIDKTKPTLEAAKLDCTGKTNSLTIDANDKDSGVASVTVNGNKCTVSNDKCTYACGDEKTFSVVIADKAGNVSTEKLSMPTIKEATYNADNKELSVIPTSGTCDKTTIDKNNIATVTITDGIKTSVEKFEIPQIETIVTWTYMTDKSEQTDAIVYCTKCDSVSFNGNKNADYNSAGKYYRIHNVALKDKGNNFVAVKSGMLEVIKSAKDITVPKFESAPEMITKGEENTIVRFKVESGFLEKKTIRAYEPENGNDLENWDTTTKDDAGKFTAKTRFNIFNGYRTFDISSNFDPYYIAIIDNDGNMTLYKGNAQYVDETAPVVKSIEFNSVTCTENANYSTGDVTLTVEAVDSVGAGEDKASGIFTIQLQLGEGEGEDKKLIDPDDNTVTISDDDHGTCTFTLTSKDFGTTLDDAKNVYIVVTDAVENSRTYPIREVSDNDEIKSNKIIIGGVGNLSTSLDIKGEDGKCYEVKEKNDSTTYWYQKDSEIIVTAKATNEGKDTISDTNVSYGSESKTIDDFTWQDSTLILTNNTFKADPDGKVSFTATNSLTGANSTVEKTVKVDGEVPSIKEFVYAANPDKTSKANTVEATNYGLFFRANTTVTFKATDVDGSGVAKVCYQKIDKNGNASKSTEIIAGNEGYSITVNANFKGDIAFIVTDNVGNTATYYASELMIIETQAQHDAEKETHIAISPSPVTNRTEADGKTPLYKSDVTLNISLADTYCGIKDAKIEIDNGTSKTKADLKLTPTETDKNLITKATSSYTVKGESNKITAKVIMTDNAGNESSKTYTFGIDKTAPSITVKYDNNSAQNDKYFKADRTATITVDDKNFTYSDKWLHVSTTGKVSFSKNQVTVTFSSEGEQKLSVWAEDLAGNTTGSSNKNGAKSESTAPWDFVLDKTAPVITVSYDNNSAQNGQYFKAARVATVVVDDKNFKNNDANVKIGASIAEGAKPSASISWSETGKGSISFKQDGDYTLDISAVDLAGNEAKSASSNSTAPWKFTVDTTAPTLEISGVTDHTAYSGTVAPSFTYHDINYNDRASEIGITGVKHGGDALPGTASNDSKGGSFKATNISVTKEADDVYTIFASIVDLAGNVTEKSLTFSVNRFGSTYDFNKATKELLKEFYTPKSKEVVIYEINVCPIKNQTVTISNNGESKTLVEGKDYVIKTSNNGWVQCAYVIDPAVFDKDGPYEVVVTSEDDAGNHNTNRTVKKNGGVVEATNVNFVVDTTDPTIVIDGVKNGKHYVATARDILVRFDDNVATAKVELYLNGKLVAVYEGKDLEKFKNGEISYKAESQNSWQTLSAISYDCAGNVSEEASVRFLLTSNLFVQFVHSLWAILITIAVLLMILYLIWKRRKDDEEDVAAAK